MTAVLDPVAVEPAAPAAATPARPRWWRPGVGVLMLLTGLLYLIDLGDSGWANAFYSAATQAGAHSWKAFFFGSSDASNFITVDKPPAVLWVTDIAARLFGVNSWSVLVPEALMGVAAVGLLAVTVRRWSGPVAGLVAGGVFALTPVAVLMFRFNNPDALLVLLLVAGYWALTKAFDSGATKWLVLAGALVGTAFLAKMLQAFLVVPPMAAVYLVCGPHTWRRRFVQLLWSGLALVVASAWWLVAVTLIPAADRPYIGGSQNNSIWNLLFGYNGFGRLSGNEVGSVGGGNGWGTTGLTRLFGDDMGSQISWLLPAALVLLVGGLLLVGRAPRTDRTRVSLLLWGGWLVVTGLTFSLGAGIIHPYYTVALAPAIAALVGVGGRAAWAARSAWLGRVVLGLGIVSGAAWGFVLLDRVPTYHPWLRGTVLAVGIVAALLIAVPPVLRRSLAALGLAAGIVAGLGGPAAYALNTASTPHSGAIPSAGPSAGFGGGFGLRAGRSSGRRGGFGGFTPSGGLVPGGAPGGAFGGFGGGRGGAGGGGGIGGLLDGSTSNAAVTAALRAGGRTYTWAAATVGSNNAAGYQLASGEPVMAIGGFNGTDPAPSLAAFEADVAAHRIHYFINSGGFGNATIGGGTADGEVSTQITSWVEAHYASADLDGTTVYDLTAAPSS